MPAGYETTLVLGTSTRLADGRWNGFHYYRVLETREAVMSGKIKTILVSGDNGRKEYNEPEAIRDDMIYYKIPESMIELDYA